MKTVNTISVMKNYGSESSVLSCSVSALCCVLWSLPDPPAPISMAFKTTLIMKEYETIFYYTG